MFNILGRYTDTVRYIFVWNEYMAYAIAWWFSASLCIRMVIVHIWNIEQSSIYHIQCVQVSFVYLC